MGCHALSRCCLKAVSMKVSGLVRLLWECVVLAGRLHPPFSFLFSAEEVSSVSCGFLRLNRTITVMRWSSRGWLM